MGWGVAPDRESGGGDTGEGGGNGVRSRRKSVAAIGEEMDGRGRTERGLEERSGVPGGKGGAESGGGRKERENSEMEEGKKGGWGESGVKGQAGRSGGTEMRPGAGSGLLRSAALGGAPAGGAAARSGRGPGGARCPWLCRVGAGPGDRPPG
ncbi:translation initiation factor IF-2-like [Pyrgilauda ruficollis]|uniref:translation initiation factor IF-2-like n=1 Tax=Pyrgilauda ruficollis TaxID=221976 RepID=UPI001B85D8D9|nr:translation initiation factor IF-2-like [Pyrgilauda ruficollis]